MTETPVKVALIDLYNREKNEGIRCITDIVTASDRQYNNQPVLLDRYETRATGDIPDLSYDVYISSGGPGSPFDGEGSAWEKNYFNLVDKIWNYNQQAAAAKKHMFFICHSYQMMARYFKFGEVSARPAKSFGILPMHRTEAGRQDYLLRDLNEPFFAADFRMYQVNQPNQKVMSDLGAVVLSLEILPANLDIEKAMMAVRISDEIVGTQFHPEADPSSMEYHLSQPERKKQVVDQYGEEAFEIMIERIRDPQTVTKTYHTVLPGFLKNAVTSLRPSAN